MFVFLKIKNKLQIHKHSEIKKIIQLPKNPTCRRKLLLNRKEINMLQGQVSQKGLTVVPIKLYSKKGIIKIEIALAKGKKLYDKRQDQKNKDWKRQKERLSKIS